MLVLRTPVPSKAAPLQTRTNSPAAGAVAERHAAATATAAAVLRQSGREAAALSAGAENSAERKAAQAGTFVGEVSSPRGAVGKQLSLHSTRSQRRATSLCPSAPLVLPPDISTETRFRPRAFSQALSAAEAAMQASKMREPVPEKPALLAQAQEATQKDSAREDLSLSSSLP